MCAAKLSAECSLCSLCQSNENLKEPQRKDQLFDVEVGAALAVAFASCACRKRSLLRVRLGDGLDRRTLETAADRQRVPPSPVCAAVPDLSFRADININKRDRLLPSTIPAIYLKYWQASSASSAARLLALIWQAKSS